MERRDTPQGGQSRVKDSDESPTKLEYGLLGIAAFAGRIAREIGVGADVEVKHQTLGAEVQDRGLRV